MTKRIIAALALGLLAAPIASVSGAPMNDRLKLFDAAQRFCIAKHLSSAELTANVLRSGNWSISHICECASALTVSKMTDQDVAQAAAPENLDSFNLKISTNMSTCVHMQP